MSKIANDKSYVKLQVMINIGGITEIKFNNTSSALIEKMSKFIRRFYSERNFILHSCKQQQFLKLRTVLIRRNIRIRFRFDNTRSANGLNYQEKIINCNKKI